VGKLTGDNKDVVHGDGSFASARAITDAWLLACNTGTDSSLIFLGTTDNQPLMLRINNENFRILSRYNIAIGLEALVANFATGEGWIGGRTT
jgi:hypothetical protein